MPRWPLTAAALALVFGCADPAPIPLVLDDAAASPAWRAVDAGTYDSCGLTTAGTPYCWGFDLLSPCGDGGCPVNARPVAVPFATMTFTSISSGGGFHCGVTDEEEAWCWGEMVFGSLGDGVTERSRRPVRVAVPGPVAAVSAGYSHACALGTDGVARCWGDPLAPLGRAATEESARLPAPVDTDVRFTRISAGVVTTCGISTEGEAWCWGGGYGTLGIGARDTACTGFPSCTRSATPVRVDGAHRWLDISVGAVSACGVVRDGSALCWGEVMPSDHPWPLYGLLGTGRFAGSTAPVGVASGIAFRRVTVGTRHACALTKAREAWCWGNNELAELGTGRSGGRSALPARVVGGLQFVSLSAEGSTCGLTTRANLWCWGSAYGGVLGDGRVGGVAAVPVRVLAPQ